MQRNESYSDRYNGYGSYSDRRNLTRIHNNNSFFSTSALLALISQQIRGINSRLGVLETKNTPITCHYCNSKTHQFKNCLRRYQNTITNRSQARFRTSPDTSGRVNYYTANVPTSRPTTTTQPLSPRRIRHIVTIPIPTSARCSGTMSRSTQTPAANSVVPDYREENGEGASSGSGQPATVNPEPRPAAPSPGQAVASGSSTPPSEYRFARIFLMFLLLFPVIIFADDNVTSAQSTERIPLDSDIVPPTAVPVKTSPKYSVTSGVVFRSVNKHIYSGSLPLFFRFELPPSSEYTFETLYSDRDQNNVTNQTSTEPTSEPSSEPSYARQRQKTVIKQTLENVFDQYINC